MSSTKSGRAYFRRGGGGGNESRTVGNESFACSCRGASLRTGVGVGLGVGVGAGLLTGGGVGFDLSIMIPPIVCVS